jgi:linoleoyl-CoA desaturase
MVGFNLSIIFNLAHIMNGNEFPILEGQYLQDEWAIHQVKTTANFATNNWFLTWYLGGLNFQIEHHIFPRMSHIHYPNIHRIVKETCQEFNIDYINYSTIWQAVIEHINYLQKLGKSQLTASN